MTTPLDHFENSLLTALREHVADRAPATHAAGQTSTSAPPSRRRPPRLLLAGIATVTAAVVGVIFVPGLGSTPAYSVQEGNAGAIEVQVNRFEDAAGLEQALAAYGINADITYVPNGGACAPGRYVPIESGSGGISLSLGIDQFRVTLDPGTVRDGEILVIDASLVELPDSVEPGTGLLDTGGIQVVVDAAVTQGPVPKCSPIPAAN